MSETTARIIPMPRRQSHPESSEVIVIGAGPAGLAAAGALTHAGINHIVLERHADLGHSWRHHYDRLHLHTLKRWSSLPHFPMPASYPRYPSRAQVVDYLEAYAEHFDIRPRFGQQVISARRESGMWVVETQDARYHGAALIVASGYNHKPITPDFAGLRSFGGHLIHSSDYKNGQEFNGERVLVVGCGNSGAEIAIDLYEYGALPELVVRSPIHVLPRELNGIPTQINSLLLAKLPTRVADALAVGLLRVMVGDLSRYGITRPDIGPARQVKEHGRVPMLDIGTVDLIKQGKIKVRPGVKRLTPDGAEFVGGSKEHYDAIILATGYKAGISEFLEGGEQVLNARGLPTRFGDEAQMIGLYFVGFKNPITGMLLEINREARQVARRLKHRLHRKRV